MKLLGNIFAFAYGILVMPLLCLMVVFLPIMSIVESVKIIQTGYTVNSDYLIIVISILAMLYFSLRFRYLRKIYIIFPSLYEVIKYLSIACIFLGLGACFLNWSYAKVDLTRHIVGIVVYVLMIVLWRVCISIYYGKFPIADIKNKKSEKLKEYNSINA